MMESTMHAPHPNPDETTSHSTKPASGQVAGYPPQCVAVADLSALQPRPTPCARAGEGTNERCANLSLLLADEAATTAFAMRLAGLLKAGMVVYLRGDLGAGKTTLVRAL
ncbi:MAG: tRNA (adenosine(37)-N6)-threonylcarbamoyltransferase complex ATPase subunit type 1 TsaE, partial [Gallionellaceae bacterium]|nr:tRNA (adenosine(37)-N6)-threonylcarbamoyltransferase complex ATPase subunit type 1 TsaE [Gallionellaceae bacterium]